MGVTAAGNTTTLCELADPPCAAESHETQKGILRFLALLV